MQEWWGLDDHIRSVCDRLAAEGFFALAPNLYRGDPTVQPSEAEQRMMALSMDQTEQDMRGAAEHLAGLTAHVATASAYSGSASGAGSPSGPRPPARGSQRR